jgi:hypothetical protein
MEQNMTTHRINLKAGNPPTAEPYEQEVYKPTGDTVIWGPEDPSNKDWAVVFYGPSPFERQVYTADHPKTEEIVVDPGPTRYPYVVCINGKISHTPIIKITP